MLVWAAGLLVGCWRGLGIGARRCRGVAGSRGRRRGCRRRGRAARAAARRRSDARRAARSSARVAADRLIFDIATRLAERRGMGRARRNGSHRRVPLAAFRRRSCAATVASSSSSIDFTTGKVAWLVDGVQAERAMQLRARYLHRTDARARAGVECRSGRRRRVAFRRSSFRPDPVVVTLRVRNAVDEEEFPLGTASPPATKLRVKADLGPVKNVLFASLIPTHYFWFTRDERPHGSSASRERSGTVSRS